LGDGVAHTLTVSTLWLAMALGAFALAAGIGAVVEPGRMPAIVAEMEDRPGLTFALGTLAFLAGTVILFAHHILYDPLSCVVTGIAVCAVAEGLALIAAPRIVFAMTRPSLLAGRPWTIFMIVLGLILFLAGLTGRADALP
jgi:hypothetical protein